jgi:hypothetical protein
MVGHTGFLTTARLLVPFEGEARGIDLAHGAPDESPG